MFCNIQRWYTSLCLRCINKLVKPSWLCATKQRRNEENMDNVLAGKLINRISSYTEYNVNIMDENGIVVASKMKERVGSFHETAYEIVKSDEDMVMVDVDNLENGVKAGVNIAIDRMCVV